MVNPQLMILPTSKLIYCTVISVSETSSLMKRGMASLSTGISALGLAMARHVRGDHNEWFIFRHRLRYIH
jgi:hypothetical protein